MANVFYPNFPIAADTDVVSCIWKLTRAMKKAGWNVVAHSDGTTKTSAGTNANDSWGSDVDPSNDVYPATFTSTKAPWIVLSGPQTLKIPLSANPTGTLLRGETITQATTAAEGELLGYVWSVADASGWAVVLPRDGTFNNSNIVTGSTSAATFTPTGTIITYAREVMIGKPTAASTVAGQLWYTCCDTVGESTSLFSYLATQTGCTALVPPGSGGTSNGFPTFGNAAAPTGGAIALRGTGGATTTADWFGSINSFSGHNAQIACVNATPSAGVSADGSFYILMSNSSFEPTAFHGWSYQRVDDGDPGDIDPYVWIQYTNQPTVNWARTSSTSFASRSVFLGSNLLQATYPAMCGYAARGVTVSSSVRDIASAFFGAVSSAVSGNNALTTNTGSVKLLNHPSVSSTPFVREKLLVFSPGTITNSFHHFKGRLRWMFATSTGSKFQTSDTNTFICVSTNNGVYPAMWIGPYDGSTTPA